jgi:hypothetical protein
MLNFVGCRPLGRRSLRCGSLRALAFAATLLFFARSGLAQFEHASPPIADKNDTRFQDVHEDFASPALASTHLMPVRPLAGFVIENPKYTVELLQVQWRWGDPLDLYVIKPKGIKKPPVILYLYSFPSETEIFKRDEYEDLVTKDGFAAVGFVSALTGHRYHDRPMKEWFISELQESLGTSTHDVQMVLNYLATRNDLDMDRVGMFAQGSGASIAIMASAVDPRIKVLDVLDPWGDWPTWMATSPFVPEDERAEYVKPDFLKKAGTLEPVDWLPKIQAKKFRLDNELFDKTTPKACAEKLRAAVPAGTSVVLYKTFDEFKAGFQDGKNLEWIHHQLQAFPDAATATRTAPVLPRP